MPVAKAGPEFELLAVNELGDACLATPAISSGTLFVRSQHFLFALGRKQPDRLRLRGIGAVAESGQRLGNAVSSSALARPRASWSMP